MSADFDRMSADFDRKSADFDRKSENGLKAVAGLRQLPTIPPTSYFWQQRTSQEQTNNTQRPRRSRSPASTTPTSDFHKRPSRNFSHNSFSAISSMITAAHKVIIYKLGAELFLRNII